MSPRICNAFETSRAEWRFAYYAPGERMAPHRHDCAQFSIVMAGRQREASRGVEVDDDGALMALKPANFRHEVTFGDAGALLLSINLHHCGEDDREIRFDRWRVRRADGMRREWTALARAMQEPDAGHDAVNDITDDLLAAMMDADAAIEKTGPPRWLLRARDAVVETNLPAEAIARDAGVHRVHLARSFRRHFGASVTELRRRARLARAANEIVQHRAAPAAASAASGFADQAHLTRDLRRETGLTPAALARIFTA